jgi:hypothetical protein
VIVGHGNVTVSVTTFVVPALTIVVSDCVVVIDTRNSLAFFFFFFVVQAPLRRVKTYQCLEVPVAKRLLVVVKSLLGKARLLLR